MPQVFLSPFAGAGAQFLDNNGVILSGGKIYTYAAGTTTPLAAYTSASGATPHANPIILDSAGRVPGGEIWLAVGSIYKFTLETSTGVLLGTYDNISGINAIELNAQNVVYDPPFTGGVATNVEAKLAQYISVKDFGAVGDGVTNDTAAIQAALTFASAQNGVVLVPYGTYILTSTLIANATLIFDGGIFEMAHTIKLNGDADLIGRNGGGVTFGNGTTYIGRTPNNYDTQILCGLDATWTGKIQGMTFRVDNIYNCYLISLWNAEGAEVSGNSLVDFYVANGGSLIGAPNSSTGITGTNTRSQKNCNITGNTIKFATGFTGAQLFQAYETEGLIISNNNTYGAGDDILNADRSTGITFSNNYISTRVGTVIINQVDNFNIIGNTIIKEDVGSGYDPSRAVLGGILLIPTDPTQTFVAKNGIVSNNTIINNSVENMPQPLLIAGVQNVIVSNNVLINKKANATFTLQATNSSSVVPSMTPVQYNRNLVVKDNLVVNGTILMSGGGTADDGIIAVGNISNGGGYPAIPMNLQGFSLTRNDYADSNIGIGAIDTDNNVNYDGNAFVPAELLGIYTLSSITAGEVSLQLVGGVQYLYTGTNIRLSQVAIQMGAAASTSATVLISEFDGATITNLGTFTITPGFKGATFTNLDSGQWLSTLVIPSTKGLRFTIDSGAMPGETVTVRLYGSKFTFN